MENYENLGKIGEGTYGVVLKCRHKETGQLVAIKKFKESDDDEQVRKTALREVRLLKTLKHDNVVNLLEVFRRKGKLYLVFEYVERTILEDLEKNVSGMDKLEVKKVLYQLLKSVHFCHSHNVIHRDIKPENLLMSNDGVLKLCDFGFARPIPGQGVKLSDYVSTRWYRAPELLVGDVYYNAGVDVWAVGCMFVELLTGVPLFPGESDLDQLWLIFKCLGILADRHLEHIRKNPVFSHIRPLQANEHDPLSKKFPNLDPEEMQFLVACLHHEPEMRPTCLQLLQFPLFDGIPQLFNDTKEVSEREQQERDQLTLKRRKLKKASVYPEEQAGGGERQQANSHASSHASGPRDARGANAQGGGWIDTTSVAHRSSTLQSDHSSTSLEQSTLAMPGPQDGASYLPNLQGRGNTPRQGQRVLNFPNLGGEQEADSREARQTEAEARGVAPVPWGVRKEIRKSSSKADDQGLPMVAQEKQNEYAVQQQRAVNKTPEQGNARGATQLFRNPQQQTFPVLGDYHFPGLPGSNATAKKAGEDERERIRQEERERMRQAHFKQVKIHPVESGHSPYMPHVYQESSSSNVASMRQLPANFHNDPRFVASRGANRSPAWEASHQNRSVPRDTRPPTRDRNENTHAYPPHSHLEGNAPVGKGVVNATPRIGENSQNTRNTQNISRNAAMMYSQHNASWRGQNPTPSTNMKPTSRRDHRKKSTKNMPV
ncbi:hypothetical protein CYMTET_57011 [Cymbomonas tetramitiformis]|uniref:cyclin-dependent kinase n=1 Tax=Cymbomonas tetramitiformis TaxID=36881 RepID=A0AAE0EL97_9CHLO|nr:hypothetical protein CYMTET_57011 [Cymbomonas tetramitiformis]